MSLGDGLYRKSTKLIARRWLAPPRDKLRLRLQSLSCSTSSPASAESQSEAFSLYTSSKTTTESQEQVTHGVAGGPLIQDHGVHGARYEQQKVPSSVAAAQECADAVKDRRSSSAESQATIRKNTHTVNGGNQTFKGLSKSQYARWNAAVAKFQIHKEHQRRRHDELIAQKHAMNSAPADWRDSYTSLKKSTSSPIPTQGAFRIWTFSARRRPVTNVRADNIVRPPEASVSSFIDYVEDLVTSSVSALRHRQLYRGTESHISAVAKQLQQLFSDTSLEPYWSVAACNLAFKFYYRHSMLDKARTLYSMMEDRHYLTSTDTFNILLLDCAHRRNVAHFQRLLGAMINRGLKPNAQTWEGFFLLNDSSNKQYAVFQSMRDRGLLDNLHTMHRFLTLNIREVLSTQLNKGHTVTWFLEYMDKLDNFKWLSTSIGNKLIDEVGKRGSIEDSMNLLDQLELRGMEFDVVTLSTLLHQCLPGRHHSLAIRILQRLRQHKVYPGKEAYESIFRQFWRSRSYNCAKVAWRYACVEGQASFAMRTLVNRSIRRGLADSSPDILLPGRGFRWQHLIGGIVVGVASRFPRHHDKLVWLGIRRVAIKPGFLSPDDTAEPAKALLEQDLQLAHHYTVDRSLHDLLYEALIMDRQWAHEHAWQHKSLEWFVDKSIDVELKHTFAARFLPLGKAPPGSQNNPDSLNET